MNANAMIDTHAEYTNLLNAGMDSKQAEAVVDLHKRMQITNFVTKDEFNEHREETRAEFVSLRNEMNERFDKIDQRFEKIDQRFEKIDQRFEKIDQRFVTVIKDIADLRVEMKSMQSKYILIMGALLSVFFALDRFL